MTTAIREALSQAFEIWQTEAQFKQAQTPTPTPTIKPEEQQMQPELPFIPSEPPKPKAQLIFEWVSASPGATIHDTVKALKPTILPETTSSYIYQMIKHRMLRRDADTLGLYALVPKYSPVKVNSSAKRRLNKAPTPTKPPKQAAPKPTPTPQPEPTSAPTLQSTPAPAPTPRPQQTPQIPQVERAFTTEEEVDSILALLNVRTAKALRDALNEIFKGI